MTPIRAAVLLVVPGLLLAGCGSSPPSQPGRPANSTTGSAAATATGSASGSTSSTAPAGPSSTVPGFASTSAGSPRDVISKPDFLIDADALCAKSAVQLRALPNPTAATDYAATVANLTGTLRIESALLSQAGALVARAGERAELERNWLDVARADFAAYQSAARRVIDAARRHDPAGVQAAANDLSEVRNHDTAVAAYLTEYGLGSCADLYAG